MIVNNINYPIHSDEGHNAMIVLYHKRCRHLHEDLFGKFHLQLLLNYVRYINLKQLVFRGLVVCCKNLLLLLKLVFHYILKSRFFRLSEESIKRIVININFLNIQFLLLFQKIYNLDSKIKYML